jgi:hypothetical protein
MPHGDMSLNDHLGTQLFGGQGEDDNFALVSSEHYPFWNKDGLSCELVGRGGKRI